MSVDVARSGVEARDLSISLSSGDHIIEGVSLRVEPGQALGLVGESGSGKTTTALALLGYTAPGVFVTGGSITVDGDQMSGRSEREVRRARGRVISYVPQDPATSLNPAQRIGNGLRVMVGTHLGGEAIEERITQVLEDVQLPSDPEFLRRFPHQLSGGQQQRVTIATAVSCKPPIVVLDEPTTGLDVITQARVIAAVDRLRREHGLGLIYVSHDLAVVSQVADQVAVMYAGRVVEEGPTQDVLGDPRHPYTRGLIEAIPDPQTIRRLRGIPGISVGVGERPSGCSFAPRCALAVEECRAGIPDLQAAGAGHEVRCIRWSEVERLELTPANVALPPPEGEPLLTVERLCIEYGPGRSAKRVVHDLDLKLHRQETLALIGESGSGKTTIARCIAGLHAPAVGKISFDGEVLAERAQARTRDARRRIQYIFQNPYDSLNPRQNVRDQIMRPVRILLGLRGEEAGKRVDSLVDRVRLPKRIGERFPTELSGGERQRVAIARALAPDPDLLICDEITSALDVSVQAAVLELLEELRGELGLAMLFITHDLGVVSSIADRGIVLQQGRICETAAIRDLLDRPTAGYTRELLSAAPRLLRRPEGESEAATSGAERPS
jgi:peptide/nickel transport system ATP-binding protein